MATMLNGSDLPPVGPSEASTLAAALPRLAQETQLQKMLADEKMRSEQHKLNYQTLKAEHTRLQDEYIGVQDELKATIEESKIVQEKYKALLEQVRKELAAKHGECEQLRHQVPSEQKLDLLKSQLKEDAELSFKEKFQRLEEETERYRNEYNKLKYEYSFLKSEYEHEKREQQKVLDELKLRHEAEVANLRREREMIIARQQSESGGDAHRVRILQRDNAQLHLKVKGLLTELEEIRSQREHLGLQSDNVTRLQSKQLAEHAANVKSLETEKESLKLQCESLQRELSATSDLQTQLTGRVHELEKINIVLKNQADEVNHKSKVDMTNLKMEMLKERGDLERERDKLSNHLEDTQSQIDILKHTIDQQASSLVDKERESVKRVQAAREAEWIKLHKVENDKLELETKLQEVERRKVDEETHQVTLREKQEEQLRAAASARETAEKEALVLRTKMQHQESLLSQVERERTENTQLKSKMHRIESQYNNYVSSENELVDLSERLKLDCEELRGRLRKTQDDLDLRTTKQDEILTQHRASWASEKVHLQQRIDELEAQVADLHSKLNQVLSAHKKKKKQMTHLISKLKNKSTLQSAQLEELTIERDALKKSIPPNAHLTLKKQLNDLVRRHKEFRSVIYTGNIDQVPIGDLSFGSASLPLNSSLPTWVSLDMNQKNLTALKERLQHLDQQQQQQLAELKGISPINSPSPHHRSDYSPVDNTDAVPVKDQDEPLRTEDLESEHT